MEGLYINKPSKQVEQTMWANIRT